MENVIKKILVVTLMFLLTALILTITFYSAKPGLSYDFFESVFYSSLIASVIIASISVAYDYVIFRIIKCRFKFWSFYCSVLPVLLLVLIMGIVEFLYIKERILLQIIAKLSGCIVTIYKAYIVHKKYDVELKKCFIYFGITIVVNFLPSLLSICC